MGNVRPIRQAHYAFFTENRGDFGMPFYQQRGSIPPKRHIQHRSESGHLYYEEHVSREGFSDVYSNTYHIHIPTRVVRVPDFQELFIEPSADKRHRHRHLETAKFPPQGDFVSGRRALLYNNDAVLYTCAPQEKSVDFFYRNAHADELIFIQKGEGLFESMFGNMRFGYGDYIIIPGGVTYKMTFDTSDNRLLVIESYGHIETPQRYRNKHGQLLEHAPFCERDFRTPEFVEPKDELGEFTIKVKMTTSQHRGIQEFIMGHHPFDLVGWDGYYYPYIFNIKDFMPITGKVHMPPPVHQTFAAPGFVICSFCPRLFDYHELSIPAPYAHSNVDSDEVLFYVEGDFMSRKGVSDQSITLHPAGLPHSPQPGKYEGSIGAKETLEYAVMFDTFRPLNVAKDADEVDDPKYPLSWME